MSDKKLSKKHKVGSHKQKPLVECKAVQLGKWVLSAELSGDFLSHIKPFIESTAGSHRQDSVTKTRFRLFERGLASGDKPSILSFGLEQFYPIEDIKNITRDETHTNVVICILKPPSLVYEVLAFRCPTEYEARQFAEHFKAIKDQSGTGFNIHLKEPPDGQELNWSMRTTGYRHVENINGADYETVAVVSGTNGDVSNVHVDKTTKTLHITTSGTQDQAPAPTSSAVLYNEEPEYAVVDKSKKLAARQAAELSGQHSTTTTTVTEERIVVPSQQTQQQTTTYVKSAEPVVLGTGSANQEKRVEVTKETIVIPPQPVQQQQTRVVKEVSYVVPQQTTQQTTVYKQSSDFVPVQTQQQTTVVKEANVVVPAQTQQQTTVVKEASVVVPAQTQQQTTVVKESNVVVPAQKTTFLREVALPLPTKKQETKVVKKVNTAGPVQTSQQTVVKEVRSESANRESLAVPGQRTHKVVRQTQSSPAVQQRTQKVVKEAQSHVAPVQRTHVVRDVEHNEVARLNARIITLEQENRYLRELLKQHSVNNKDLELFMKKETITNGPQVDSLVIVDGENSHSHQTMKYSREGEAAIIVGDHRSTMTRTDSDRSHGSFVQVRGHRGLGKQVLDDYNGGSLRSLQSGSLYASSVRGASIYADGQNIYSSARVGVRPQVPLNYYHHSHHRDIINETIASPNSGYLIVPAGTFKKSSKGGHTYITKPIDKVYAHPVPVIPVADDYEGSISVSDDEDVFEVNSPTPVKLV